MNSEVLWLFAKFSLQNFGRWHLLVTPASNPQEFPAKILDSTNSQKFFSHKSFLLCGTGNEVTKRLYVPFPFSPFLVDLLCLGDFSRQQ